MMLRKGLLLIIGAAVVAAGVMFIAGCEEDIADITRPQVQYNDQTFSLLVCDGNNNTPFSWGHDGAPVCTLDWNNDGNGPNRLPVYYVYNVYPIVDGRVTASTTTDRGDKFVWDQHPWTTIQTAPVYAGGSGVTQVKAKAIYTYVNPPRIWFLFQWEDPSHTICSDFDETPKGAMYYYWLQRKPGSGQAPGDGFKDAREWDSREDWLALVWSTWFLHSTKDPNVVPDPSKSYEWELVETVPGFQQNGIGVLESQGETVYRTPAVNTGAAPYNQTGYMGPVCDFWFWSASRTNYTSALGWDTTEVPFVADCKITRDGFTRPIVPGNDIEGSEEEFLPWDSGVTGNKANRLENSRHYPGNQSADDPGDNPPGALYLWSSSATAPPFVISAPWPADGGARIAGYLERPSLGSAADVQGRGSWEDPTWWGDDLDPDNGGQCKYRNYLYWGDPPNKNEIGVDWNYTVELEREIGFVDKIDPEEDTLLGLFNPHPGE